MTANSTEVRKWLDRARSVELSVQKYREESERDRSLPRPLFEAMREAGLFRLMVPRELGGGQAPLEAVVRVIEEISRQDGATGWNTMIATHMNLLADYLAPTAAQEIYGPPERLVAGSFTPRGRATAAEGGFRVTGHWSFASGCANAEWMVGACVVQDDGQLPAPGQPPDVRLFFMPMADCQIVDAWYTAGLRGTGSQDFLATDIFVPAHRSFPLADFYVGPQGRPVPAYSRAFFEIAAPQMTAVSLGIARDAIDSFRTMATSKLPARGSTLLADQHTIHEKVGRAEALLRSARAYVYETTDLLSAPPDADGDSASETKASVRLACAFAAQMATEAVDLVFDAGGGSSIYAGSRLERCFRDVHMVTHHILVAPSNIEMVGQYLLGLGLQERR